MIVVELVTGCVRLNLWIARAVWRHLSRPFDETSDEVVFDQPSEALVTDLLAAMAEHDAAYIGALPPSVYQHFRSRFERESRHVLSSMG